MSSVVPGAKLSAQDLFRIVRPLGPFSLERIDMTTDEGGTLPFIFDPPFKMESGTVYAFTHPAAGEAPVLWEVEQRGGPRDYVWVREAPRTRTLH